MLKDMLFDFILFSSNYNGVSKSFAFSFTGTKSGTTIGYFPIIFTIVSAEGNSTLAGNPHGNIHIKSNKMDVISSDTLSLSNNTKIYGMYTVEYDDSNTDEYVKTIQDAITIDLCGMKPDCFGSGNYVKFDMALDGANPINSSQTTQTRTIYSKVLSENYLINHEIGTISLSDIQPLTCNVNIDKLSDNSSLSGQQWTNSISISQSFDTVECSLCCSTDTSIRIKLILYIDVKTN